MPCSVMYGHAEMAAYPHSNETRTGINFKHLQKIQRERHRVSLVTQDKGAADHELTAWPRDHY